MAKFVATKMLFVLGFVVLWFGSPAFGDWTTSTNTPCILRIVRGECGTAVVDYTACCLEIAQETRDSTVCMCTAFNNDVEFLTGYITYCSASYSRVLTICQDVSLTTPSSSSDQFSTPDSSLTTPSSSNKFSTPDSSDQFSTPDSGNKSTTTIIAVTVVIVAVLIAVGISIYCICRGRKRRNALNAANYPPNAYVDINLQNVQSSHSVPINNAYSTPPPMSTVPQPSSETKKDNFATPDSSLQYDLATIQAATDNFSDENKIGRGGFGFVYKGILSNGQEIAVKRLSHDSGQGDKEFKTEIELLAKLQHRNLVKLFGYCLVDKEALLVYEFLPNKSLDYFLFDNKKREELNWTIRFEIIKGIARGILYLHEDSPLRTVHRDLKSGNVLLDADMNPKIADFGLARICALEQTHVDATRVVGTRGYMSPEYLLHGQFSVKSDVYAFGVLLLEIISGRRIGQVSELSENLMSYAWRCWADEKPLALMDPLLKDSCSNDEVIKCIHLGLLCVQDDLTKRPNMSAIVHKLNSNAEVAMLSMPQHPGFLYSGTSGQSTTSVTTQTVTGSSGAGSSSAWSSIKT